MNDVLFYYDIFFQKRIVITTFRAVYFCCFTIEEMDVILCSLLTSIHTINIYIDDLISFECFVFLNFFKMNFF